MIENRHRAPIRILERGSWCRQTDHRHPPTPCYLPGLFLTFLDRPVCQDLPCDNSCALLDSGKSQNPVATERTLSQRLSMTRGGDVSHRISRAPRNIVCSVPISKLEALNFRHLSQMPETFFPSASYSILLLWKLRSCSAIWSSTRLCLALGSPRPRTRHQTALLHSIHRSVPLHLIYRFDLGMQLIKVP
ncbi:hypothetical protein IQ07DRAFT_315378 [Pyrenochaeta sp. DS3sAY3a]|nr:hypothetical protein IQ07DRAFT_315378 [Pyrenochaeta sp. DS3sAY3a]